MSIRGGGLFKTLFGEEELALPEADKKRGRDTELVAQRNEHLLMRFIQIGKERPDMKYDYIVKLLVKEFYLAESTIGQLIEDNSDVLHRIRKEGNEAKILKEKYAAVGLKLITL